ncbi:MAG: hypothetical protein NC489_44835 [Ruminococcus flavefaciens]|nr:hypothetical protein [Ruminococcus flavefaciens]
MKSILKKVIVISLCCILLVGCGGNKKPDDVSQETYDLAVYTIKVVDLYLNGEATLDDTYSKTKEMKVKFDYDSEYKQEDVVLTAIYCVQSDISIMSLREKANSSDLSTLKQDRDKLAKKINYKD